MIDKNSLHYKQFVASIPRGKEVVGKLVDAVNSVSIRFYGDIQAINENISGGQDEEYVVVLGKTEQEITLSKLVLKNKFTSGPKSFPNVSLEILKTSYKKEPNASYKEKPDVIYEISSLSELPEVFAEIDINETIEKDKILAVSVTIPPGTAVSFAIELVS